MCNEGLSSDHLSWPIEQAMLDYDNGMLDYSHDEMQEMHVT